MTALGVSRLFGTLLGLIGGVIVYLVQTQGVVLTVEGDWGAMIPALGALVAAAVVGRLSTAASVTAACVLVAYAAAGDVLVWLAGVSLFH